ncbi:MAG: hypothetical protein J3K34DRAFT_492346 [Monoraphidium minutum]|nr:MAG: hypothetical protein J3K34DRAFT_492346 [Monoraphidium minutum]
MPSPAAARAAAAAAQGLSWDALQTALSVINEGIAVADPSLPDAPMVRTVYVNDAFLRLTGYTRAECLGRNCRFLQGPGTEGPALARLRGALAAREDCQVELLNYRKDGAPFWNLLSITHVWAPEGEQQPQQQQQQQQQQQEEGGGAEAGGGRRLQYLIGVQSDVSDLARKAQAAQAARNRFIANMSHELRTPLNGILATAQLLLASQLSPEQRELADTILDSSLSLLGTLGDILDFSLLEAAPESDGLALRHEPVCLQQALEAVAEMVSPAAAAKGLELAFLLDTSVLARGPHIWGDATRLRQVLHHLVSNAVKYSDSGEVIVRARLAPDAQQQQQQQQQEAFVDGSGGGGALLVSVQDSGIGMSREMQAGLFQSFRQGSDALNRRYGGTGLGLALSKRLAEAMGGDILVDSTLGKGSTFTLVLRPEWCDDDGDEAGGGGGGGAKEAPAGAPAAGGGGGGAPGGSSGALSAADSAGGGAATSSGDLSSGSACGSPGRGAAGGARGGGGGGGALGAPPPPRASIGSLQPSSASSDLDPEGCICGCAQVHAYAAGQLAGRTAYVDVPHPLIAAQVCQLLAQLGMRPLPAAPGDEAPPGGQQQQQNGGGGGGAGGSAGAGGAAAVVVGGGGYGAHDQADVAVVSACRVTPALRRGWRGRPLVVIGGPDELPERLHPLVVLVGKPLRLARMAAALQKAAGMLSWQGGAEHAPRLGRAPARAAQAGAPAGGGPGGGGAAAGGGGGGKERWRLRASIDNSALRHSPPSQPLAPAEPPPQQQPQPQPTAAAPPQPPPLDLAGGAAEARPPGAMMRSLTTAMRSVFSGAAAKKPPPDAPAPGAPPPPPAAAPAAKPPAPKPAAPAAAAPARPPLRILIAEDNRVNQMVLLKVLQSVLPGCAPDVVANGLQVLEAVHGKDYDLIFMDVHMPEMDGVTASERIRDACPPPAPRPRIVAVTADTLASLRQRCAEAGIEGFISKPFRVEDLRRVVERFGLGAHAAPSPAPPPAPAAGAAAAPALASVAG